MDEPKVKTIGTLLKKAEGEFALMFGGAKEIPLPISEMDYELQEKAPIHLTFGRTETAPPEPLYESFLELLRPSEAPNQHLRDLLKERVEDRFRQAHLDWRTAKEAIEERNRAAQWEHARGCTDLGAGGVWHRFILLGTNSYMPATDWRNIWLFRSKFIGVEANELSTNDEIALFVQKHVLRMEGKLVRMKREIEAFRNMERAHDAIRERIPESVRLFVWQRDGGKCIKCGNRERLEFDHIIPVSEGGSSTERNIQLLCETCNRKKGKNV